MIALTRWRWATRGLRVCVGSPPHPRGQTHYRPIFMAAIARQSSAGGPCSPASGWGGMLALALLPQPPKGAQPTQRPLVHSAVGSGVLAAAKPAVKDLAQGPRIPDEATDDSTPVRAAEAAPTRGKTFSKHSSTHRA